MLGKDQVVNPRRHPTGVTRRSDLEHGRAAAQQHRDEPLPTKRPSSRDISGKHRQRRKQVSLVGKANWQPRNELLKRKNRAMNSHRTKYLCENVQKLKTYIT